MQNEKINSGSADITFEAYPGYLKVALHGIEVMRPMSSDEMEELSLALWAAAEEWRALQRTKVSQPQTLSWRV